MKLPIFIIIFALPLLFFNAVVFAQGVNVVSNTTTTTANSTPGGTSFFGTTSPQCMEISLAPFLSQCPQSPAEYIVALYRLAIYAAIIAAIIQITIAGISYATAGDNASKQKEATGQIKDAVVGLVLILSAVLILRVINPNLTQLKLPGIENQMGNQELKESEIDVAQKNAKKLYETCVEKICAQVPEGSSVQCIKACQALYSYTYSDPAKCYSDCCRQWIWTGFFPTPINICSDAEGKQRCAAVCNYSPN